MPLTFRSSHLSIAALLLQAPSLFSKTPPTPAPGFGMLTLALGVGSGAHLLRPMAIAIIGGVLVSMVLSLMITPVIFFMPRCGGATV